MPFTCPIIENYCLGVVHLKQRNGKKQVGQVGQVGQTENRVDNKRLAGAVLSDQLLEGRTGRTENAIF